MVAVARIRPVRDSEPLTVGWVCHLAWEAYYKTIKLFQDDLGEPPLREDADRFYHYLWGGLPEAERAAMRVVELYAREPGYAATYEQCSNVISHYVDRYRKQDEWRVLAVEETLTWQEPLEHPVALYDAQGNLHAEQTAFQYSCRLDTLVQDLGKGREGTWIVECKTAKWINEDLVSAYQLDMQVLGQLWLWKRCVAEDAYPRFRGIVVNIASKSKTPEFERVEVLPSQHHLRAFEESTRQWAFINKVFEAAGYPRALGSCAGALRGYSRCQFYDLCYGRPELGIEDWKTIDPPPGFYRENRSLEEIETYDEVFG